MKFRLRKFDLQNELAALAAVVDKKNKDEILQCVHISKSDTSSIQLSCSSRELMLTTSIKIDGGSGLLTTEALPKESCAIEAAKLFELCRKLPDKMIEIDYDQAKMKATVRCDSSRYSISCLEPSLFPSIRTPSNYTHKVPLRFFAGAIKRSLELIEERESVEVYYCGALVILKDKVLEVIATDGKRMATWQTTTETDREFKVILPKRTLTELATVMESSSQPVLNLEITSNHAFFNFGKYTYQSAILVGSFPNYEIIVQSIRTMNDVAFRINRARMLQALERCLIFTGKNQGHGVNLDFSNKEVGLTVANERGDHVFEPVEADCPQVHAMRINGEFLKQYLQSVPNDDTVDMYVNSREPMKPVYFRSQNDRNYFWCVSPMERV